MTNDRCGFCGTAYTDDRDANGKPYCECLGAQVAELTAALAATIVRMEEAEAALQDIYDIANEAKVIEDEGVLASSEIKWMLSNALTDIMAKADSVLSG